MKRKSRCCRQILVKRKDRKLRGINQIVRSKEVIKNKNKKKSGRIEVNRKEAHVISWRRS